MRSARHFSPEWGYLAPAPGFISAVRIALVAAAVGASAGAAVVFSLVDRPAADETVAARTLVKTVDAAPVLVSTPVAPVASAESSAESTTQRPESTAALAESPRMTEADAAPRNRTTSTPNAAPRQVGATKKQPYVGWWRNAPRGEQAARAPLALVRSLGTRATD